MLTLSALLQTSHAMLRAYCSPGDAALDATMGNGRDTVFLAELVGESGMVLAMDKQAEALDRTADLLDVMDLTMRVQLMQCSHADVEDMLPLMMQSAKRTSLAAAVFNLGFRPGGDKKITTDPVSTIRALNAVWPRIRPGGLLSVHAYSGHDGAAAELEAVAEWMRVLPWNDAQVSSCTQYNKAENPETLFLVLKVPK